LAQCNILKYHGKLQLEFDISDNKQKKQFSEKKFPISVRNKMPDYDFDDEFGDIDCKQKLTKASFMQLTYKKLESSCCVGICWPLQDGKRW